MPKTSIKQTSGNVFADLGLPDADELLAKAELALRICEIIKERRLSQARAAKLLHLSHDALRDRIQKLALP